MSFSIVSFPEEKATEIVQATKQCCGKCINVLNYILQFRNRSRRATRAEKESTIESSAIESVPVAPKRTRNAPTLLVKRQLKFSPVKGPRLVLFNPEPSPRVNPKNAKNSSSSSDGEPFSNESVINSSLPPQITEPSALPSKTSLPEVEFVNCDDKSLYDLVKLIHEREQKFHSIVAKKLIDLDQVKEISRKLSSNTIRDIIPAEGQDSCHFKTTVATLEVFDVFHEILKNDQK